MTKKSLLSALVILAAATGCKTIDTDWMPKAPWSKSSELVESQYDTPVRMAAIWTPDILGRPGMPASRGFGGRLYFYNKFNKPVKVEGQLVVYAYDDSAQEQQRETPDRKYAFTPEQFTSHHSESELGESYSVWLPWDTDAAGEQKSISLVPVFTSTSGQIVMGQQAVNLLKGKKAKRVSEAPEAALSQNATVGVQPVGFEENRNARQSAARGSRSSIKTTTINLSRTMQQRVIEAAKNRAPQAPLGTANPAMVERARATLAEMQANSSLPMEAGSPTLASPSTRFAPPRPRVPSSPTVRSNVSRVPSRPAQPVRRFAAPSSPQPTGPTPNSGFGTVVGPTGR